MKALASLFVVLALSVFTAPAFAHKASDAYLTVQARDDQLALRWDVALRDLDDAVGLDADDDGALNWAEVQERWSDIDALLRAALTLRTDAGACTLAPAPAVQPALTQHSDGAYAVLRYAASCATSAQHVTVNYRLFATSDPTHRGIVRIDTASGSSGIVLGPDKPSWRFDVAGTSRWTAARQFLVEGVWHIWQGTDHILFLLALLLPAVLERAPAGSRRRWIGVAQARTAVRDILGVVTAFTIAHSLTLTLAVLGFVSLPSRVVEPAIAATVVVSAINNVWQILPGRRWMVAFVFGLVHGFGFASVLQDIGLPSDALAPALLAFNVGVELGQFAIVLAVAPVIFALRSTRFYQRVVLTAGSCAVALVAAGWFVERAWNVSLFVTSRIGS